MEREPIVAGQFYPARIDGLKKEVRRCMDETMKKRDVKGIVSPHAGYVYSGEVAGAVFSRIKIPDIFIILGPNHTGLGKPFALWKEGKWKTPLGSTEIDKELAEAILNGSSLIEADYQAHLREHSLEVQLPFIQYLSDSVKIVPLVLGLGTLPQLQKVSQAIVKAIQGSKKKVIIIASSDMSHYLPQEEAERLDKIALEPLLKLEAKKFFDTVVNNNISMCGYLPATVMIMACKALGSQKGDLIKYNTSGDVSGDYFQVVGYAGVIVE